jgi:hypothetical protein
MSQSSMVAECRHGNMPEMYNLVVNTILISTILNNKDKSAHKKIYKTSFIGKVISKFIERRRINCICKKEVSS